MNSDTSQADPFALTRIIWEQVGETIEVFGRYITEQAREIVELRNKLETKEEAQ